MQTITLTHKENYAIAQLNRGKANPMNRQMIQELTELVHQLAHNFEVKGLIITGKEHYFSAGLDLLELYQFNPKEMEDFWRDFSKMMLSLASFPKPMVIAITGHSPAGGCILALCGDYRVMAEGSYRIGLNEVPVGIIVPNHIFALYAFWIGNRNAYQYLMEGKLLLPQEALQAQLVDEIVPLEEVLNKAETKIKHYLSFDPVTWQKTKTNLRKDLIKALNITSTDSFKETLEHWWSPEVRHILHTILASLKK
ncbi:MAG: enoyl-CoA hydratase/isomerase family protein [Thermoflexibacter sp.]